MKDKIKEFARFFKALSDETRLKMLILLLNNKELCVCDFMNVLGISQSKASRHLRYLFNIGLFQERREQVWIYYRISEEISKDKLILLESLKNILSNECYIELETRLNEWLKEKAKIQTYCK